jgi:hypothetical protein
MNTQTLECSHEQFHELHEAVDRTRDCSETVKVPKTALAALLRDHGKLIRLHRNQLDGIL